MPLNTRVYKPSMLEKVSDVDKRKFESRNFLDVALYNFFFESFMARLSNQTDDFFQEVKYFKNLQTRVELFCMVTTSNGTALVVNESRWNDRFLVGYADCLKMSMEELTFVEGLRMRHLEQLYKNLWYKGRTIPKANLVYKGAWASWWRHTLYTIHNLPMLVLYSLVIPCV